LLECSKDISRIVAEKLCDRRVEFREKGHSTTATEATAMTEEEHFKAEEVGLSDKCLLGIVTWNLVLTKMISTNIRFECTSMFRATMYI